MSGLATQEQAGSTTFSVAGKEAAPTRQIASLLRSEPVLLVAMLVALGIYYLIPTLAVRGVGALAFLALSVYRPDLNLAMVPLAAPLFYRMWPIGRLYISLPEF